jgi:hypothetical protein
MSAKRDAATDPQAPQLYQIRLRGHLDSQWADWFGGLTVALTDDGDTLLTGPVADQAALHGLLRKVRDLGLTLLAVQCVPTGATAVLPHTSTETQPPNET